MFCDFKSKYGVETKDPAEPEFLFQPLGFKRKSRANVRNPRYITNKPSLLIVGYYSVVSFDRA
jgi:hypothetical protein